MSVKKYNANTSYIDWLRDKYNLPKDKPVPPSYFYGGNQKDELEFINDTKGVLEFTIDTSLKKTKLNKELARLKPLISNPDIHLKVNFVNKSKLKQ